MTTLFLEICDTGSTQYLHLKLCVKCPIQKQSLAWYFCQYVLHLGEYIAIYQ